MNIGNMTRWNTKSLTNHPYMNSPKKVEEMCILGETTVEEMYILDGHGDEGDGSCRHGSKVALRQAQIRFQMLLQQQLQQVQTCMVRQF